MKLFRAVIVGLVIATILLMAIPSIRPKRLTDLLDGKKDEQPISYSKAVRRAAPAVVYVYSSGTGSFSQNGRELTALGSGVIMSSNGYIVTNRHVVNNADQIQLALPDGLIFHALIVGLDSLTDLAVLKIDAENLPVILINPQRK